MLRRIHILHVGLLFFLCLSLLQMSGCSRESGAPASTAKELLKIGYPASPLLGVVFAAEEHRSTTGKSWELQRMGSGGDIGYALVSGSLDAGFIETSKALELLKTPGGEKLKLAGVVKFPYGAVVVMRKGLNIRLDELPGKKLAAEDDDCVLFHQFKRDLKRHGVNSGTITFTYMPFGDMLPALEAKAVDGIVTKASYGVAAELQGHTILYQNWDLKPGGDECCPAFLAQIEYFLVVREDAVGKLKPFYAALKTATALPPKDIRRAAVAKLGYPQQALETFPVADFAAVEDSLRKELGERKCVLLN
jgi:ABC-type nitrate/sulfonate/bicarbonate transport system substrate-binding protein